MKNLNERIRSRRLELNLSQQDLAKRTGNRLVRQYINRLENPRKDGKDRSIGMKNIMLLAAALETSPCWLAFGIEDTTTASPSLLQVPIITWEEAGQKIKRASDINDPTAYHYVALIGDSNHNSFVLINNCASMTPTAPHYTYFLRNDYLFFDPTKKPHEGNFVLVRQKKIPKAFFRLLIEDKGRWYLQPLNKQFEVLELTSDIFVHAVLTARMTLFDKEKK